MKLWFFTREAFRAMRRNAAPSVAAIVTTAVTVVLLGMLFPVLDVADSKSNEVRSELQFRVAVYDDATKADIKELNGQLKAIPHVKSVDFLTKAQALQELKGFLKDDTDPIKALNGRNPLPANFIVRPDDAKNLDGILRAIEPRGPNGKPRPINSVISDIFDPHEDRQKIEQVTGALKVVLLIITILLVGASLMLIGNTIRLSIFTRRREVEVMRLVGATRWFIRWPFMIEGIIVGFLGGAAAILVLWIGKITIVDPLSDSFGGLLAQQDTMSFPFLVAILFLSAIVVSAVGSGVTLRRFLRV